MAGYIIEKLSSENCRVKTSLDLFTQVKNNNQNLIDHTGRPLHASNSKWSIMDKMWIKTSTFRYFGMDSEFKAAHVPGIFGKSSVRVETAGGIFIHILWNTQITIQLSNSLLLATWIVSLCSWVLSLVRCLRFSFWENKWQEVCLC